MWADIKWHKSTLLQITVYEDPPSDQDFKDFLGIWEDMYKQINFQFVMAINFRDMHELKLNQAMYCIKLFFRVLDVTKEHLVCTIVCINDRLREASDIFLKLYNPSRPYYVLFNHEEFENECKLRRKELKKISDK
jgi:hypothetical protein